MVTKRCLSKGLSNLAITFFQQYPSTPSSTLALAEALRRLLPAACCLFFLTGCGGSPSAANITLRKENQKLRAQIVELNHQHDSDRATLQTYQNKNAILPVLPQDRLNKLIVAQGLTIGRLTGGHTADSASHDDGVSVYVSPIDADGDLIKTSGTFTVEMFDLDSPNAPLIGTWKFDLDQIRKLYYSQLSLHTYILPCPWQTIPAHNDLTVRVTFVDELTARQFTAQVQIKVNPPPSPAS